MPESDWPEYRLVNGFEYHFGGMSEWPNDMVRVHPVDRTETVIYFLGSLAARRCLRDTKEVHVVISLCTSEMQRIRGQPEEGRAAFLIGMSVEHVTIDVDDPRTKWPGEDYFCEEMGDCYFAAWQNMCIKISRSLLGRGDNLSTGLLFHCFGGINRSSAALAAWLIFKHAMNADDAIDVLLKARPTLNPWVKRPHILWALKTWEKRRNDANVEEIEVFSVHVTKVDARFPAVSAVIRKQVLAQCAKKRCGSLPGTQESSGLAQRAKNQCLPIVSP
ncbi:unnamed protein product [Cladocopium goreaui]|uniref:Tyrosine specific protein phosphatases domain-containing protein n=1 Tax=Cladocopium goreaui TaxID=2562237 RepID=A0A9P1DE53_9DINO|nr:unnamed protein product [Cladocopium goreaui]